MSQENKEEKLVYKLGKQSKLVQVISNTDINCSYFIGKKIVPDMEIVGAEDMDIAKETYTDEDRMFVNKGARDGLQEGDVLMIMESGPKIINPFTNENLGYYYLKKSLAEISCLYDDRAIITLQKGCFPVHMSDLVVPYKPEETLSAANFQYKRCRLPESAFEGKVVYISDMGSKKEMAGLNEYVTTDFGKAIVSRGNFLLFFKVLRKDLPPVIIGIGVVLNTQNSNSTVKILDCALPIELGTRVVMVSPDEQLKMLSDEDIPIVQALRKQQEELDGTSEEGLEGKPVKELEILFMIGKNEVSEDYKLKISEFQSEFKDSEYKLILRGYTCSIGNLEYNLQLAKERVDNVKNYLMKELSIPEDKIETYFYGEKEAPFDNSSEETRLKNRRVTLELIK
jgi:outer membrane protein OmpA-like peptidoglycan-associated protein